MGRRIVSDNDIVKVNTKKWFGRGTIEALCDIFIDKLYALDIDLRDPDPEKVAEVQRKISHECEQVRFRSVLLAREEVLHPRKAAVHTDPEHPSHGGW